MEFAGPRELGQHLRWSSTPEVILKRWTECPHTDEFERGQLAPAEWADRFIKDWDVDLTAAEFLGKFTTWSRRVLPGAKELLEALRTRYRLAALSNSNELHWERNTNELRIIELFEFAISSHQVGLCKPHPDIYRAAIDRASHRRRDRLLRRSRGKRRGGARRRHAGAPGTRRRSIARAIGQ